MSDVTLVPNIDGAILALVVIGLLLMAGGFLIRRMFPRVAVLGGLLCLAGAIPLRSAMKGYSYSRPARYVCGDRW